MSKSNPANLPASIRQRLLDLLGYGAGSEEQLAATFREVCQVEAEPDGIAFDAESVRVTEIREDQEYGGKRVEVLARLGTARIRLRIDIGFGDAVTLKPDRVEYPTLLDLPSPRILVYPRETVVAEKLQAMVALGMVNSRMKDFFDLLVIAEQISFDGPLLVEAIRATFDRRQTIIPEAIPVGLRDEFATNQDKQTQWRAFLRRSRLDTPLAGLAEVIDTLRSFLAPPLGAAARRAAFDQSWQPGGPWS